MSRRRVRKVRHVEAVYNPPAKMPLEDWVATIPTKGLRATARELGHLDRMRSLLLHGVHVIELAAVKGTARFRVDVGDEWRVVERAEP